MNAPSCPRCLSPDRVHRIDAPDWAWICAPCVLCFTGSDREFAAMGPVRYQLTQDRLRATTRPRHGGYT